MKRFAVFAMTALLALTSAAAAAEDFIIVQSTTSTQNSGLFDHILPMFQAETGIEVRVVAVGSGQALKNAANGDGDVLFAHAKSDEEEFVARGHGLRRDDVMYNDFVLIGPRADPAGVRGAADVAAALRRIAGGAAPFLSRGDDSGTNKAELRLWETAGIDAQAASGGWYLETGSGMGATLNMAAALGAYALTDRATWISFANKGKLEILSQGDPRLFNQYGATLVNPQRHPNVKAAAGQAFIDWLLSGRGQAAIGGYRIDGRQLFFPNARRRR